VWHRFRHANEWCPVLRIDREDRKGVTVLRVEGRLCGDEVAELTRESGRVTGRLELDLAELLTADEVGLSLLRSLRESGAALTGASPFIELLLGGSNDEKHRRGDAA